MGENPYEAPKTEGRVDSSPNDNRESRATVILVGVMILVPCGIGALCIFGLLFATLFGWA